MKNIFIHIGTPKTGSCSLQRWMLDHESFLKKANYALYQGMYVKRNHTELYLAAMRYSRDSFGKHSRREITFDESYTSKVSERVRNFISRSDEKNIILTTEGLSFLRHKDETAKLKSFLGPSFDNIKIILFLRDKKDFLKSYRMQLSRKSERKPSKDYWSALYVEDDTWLIDYEQLIAAYANEFGEGNVTVIDYDEEMELKGNIIPSFIKAIGLETEAEIEKSMQTYRYNASSSREKKSMLKQGLKKLKHCLTMNRE